MKGLVVDGSADDWKGFFWSESEIKGQASDTPTPLYLAIAPSESQVFFCLRSGAESPDWLKKWSDVRLRLTVREDDGESLDLILARRGIVVWEWKRGAYFRVRVAPNAVEYVFGPCLEGRIDLRLLLSGGHGLFSPDCLYPLRTPRLRVSTTLWEPYQRDKAGKVPSAARHFGPEVASYRLCPDKFAPAWADDITGEADAVTSPFCMREKCLVFQGPDGWPTHEGRIAYDLCPVDSRGCAFRGERTSRNEAFYGWGATIYAPSEGIVRAVRNDRNDREPGGDPRRLHELAAEGNMLYREEPNMLSVEGPFRWELFHLRRGSIDKSVDEAVFRGEPVAAVGNSGTSPGPHLHFEVFKKGAVTQAKLILEDVAVGLNSAPEDPWEVRLPSWVAEEGYFVRRLDDAR